MKKIKISSGYDTSENLTQRLLIQFKTSEIDLTNIQFVYDDSYDIIIFFSYINEEIKFGKQGFVIPHEPSWTGSHQKIFKDNTTVLGFDKNLYIGKCIETVAHTFYGGRGPWIDKLDFWSYENLFDKIFTKSKNISSSITNINVNYGETCLYPQRYEISKLISDLSFVDSFDGSNNKPEKKDALIDYKFNLVIENEYYQNWVTEKFYDAILTDTIPIYYGCKNIKEIYPEGGYILINDVNNLNEIKEQLEFINLNSDEIYLKNINLIRKIKKKYFSEHNLLKLIINL
jgi:hypothetical protein